jgi:hypothetical protein
MGVHTHTRGQPKIAMMFPLEPLVHGRKCIRRKREILNNVNDNDKETEVQNHTSVDALKAIKREQGEF